MYTLGVGLRTMVPQGLPYGAQEPFVAAAAAEKPCVLAERFHQLLFGVVVAVTVRPADILFVLRRSDKEWVPDATQTAKLRGAGAAAVPVPDPAHYALVASHYTATMRCIRLQELTAFIALQTAEGEAEAEAPGEAAGGAGAAPGGSPSVPDRVTQLVQHIERLYRVREPYVRCAGDYFVKSSAQRLFYRGPLSIDNVAWVPSVGMMLAGFCKNTGWYTHRPGLPPLSWWSLVGYPIAILAALAHYPLHRSPHSLVEYLVHPVLCDLPFVIARLCLWSSSAAEDTIADVLHNTAPHPCAGRDITQPMATCVIHWRGWNLGVYHGRLERLVCAIDAMLNTREHTLLAAYLKHCFGAADDTVDVAAAAAAPVPHVRISLVEGAPDSAPVDTAAVAVAAAPAPAPTADESTVAVAAVATEAEGKDA